MDNDTNVNIAVRVRPLLPNEFKNVITHIEEENVLIVSEGKNVFAFDQVFPCSSLQSDIYNTMITPLFSKVLDGYNCTVLAYGQTGTGKTYTMGTNMKKNYGEEAGLISRVLDESFTNLEKKLNTSLSISFIEIYNEKVYDLLATKKTPLVVKGFQVKDICIISVDTQFVAQNWLRVGSQNRHVGHTTLNTSSSRSHAIFTIYYTKDGITSKLHLVDLAGSESVRRTGNKGKAFREGITINKGLLAIGRVITALTKESKSIPYRESTLTTILQDSLNANNFISLLACISPSSEDITETLTTLRFAEKAKILKSRPQLASIAAEYERKNPGSLEGCSTVRNHSRYRFFTSTQRKQPKSSIVSNLFNSQNEEVMSPVNMDSLSVSTSTLKDETSISNSNWRPLVRRYTKLIEKTMVAELQSIVENSDKNEETNSGDKNIQTTLSLLPWNLLEKRVTQVVRNEISKLTQTDQKENQSPTLKRKLDFSNETILATSLKDVKDKSDSDFKVPVGVPTKKQKRKHENILAKDNAVRRSARLSSKITDFIKPQDPDKQQTVVNNNRKCFTDITNSPRSKTFSEQIKTDIERNEILRRNNPLEVKPRRSVRLSLKYTEAPIQLPTPAPRIRNIETPPLPAPRTSMLNVTKENNINGSFDKTIIINNHRKKVLAILNTGTQKHLQTLQTVGVKTATQIIQFRSIYGNLKNFEDLGKMPSWRGIGFNRFMESNLLT